jgi:hypothetical protein
MPRYGKYHPKKPNIQYEYTKKNFNKITDICIDWLRLILLDPDPDPKWLFFMKHL